MTDEFECLSQFSGCIVSKSIEYGHCGEASLYTNSFMWETRTLPTAERYRLHKYNGTAKVSYFDNIDYVTEYKDDQTITEMNSVKQYFKPALDHFNNKIAAFISDCLLAGNTEVDTYVTDEQPLTVKTVDQDPSLKYMDFNLSALDTDDHDVTIVEFDQCYVCGSIVLLGIEKNFIHLQQVYQIPIRSIWDNETCVMRSNLGFEVPVFYNDSEGIHREQTIAYIIGDGVRLTKVDNPMHSDLLIAVSEFKSLDFLKGDDYPYGDFVLYHNKSTETNPNAGFDVKIFFLDCLLTHDDENSLTFNFKNNYVMCRVPYDILKNLDDRDTLFPVYRAPKEKFYHKKEDDSKTKQLAWIITVSGVVFIIIVIAVNIFLQIY